GCGSSSCVRSIGVIDRDPASCNASSAAKASPTTTPTDLWSSVDCTAAEQYKVIVEACMELPSRDLLLSFLIIVCAFKNSARLNADQSLTDCNFTIYHKSGMGIADICN